MAEAFDVEQLHGYEMTAVFPMQHGGNDRSARVLLAASSEAMAKAQMEVLFANATDIETHHVHDKVYVCRPKPAAAPAPAPAPAPKEAAKPVEEKK